MKGTSFKNSLAILYATAIHTPFLYAGIFAVVTTAFVKDPACHGTANAIQAKPVVAQSKYIWLSAPPDQKDWVDLAHNPRWSYPEEGSSLAALRFSDRGKVPDTTRPNDSTYIATENGVQQTIRENGEFESSLLESSENGILHEAGQLRAVSKSHEYRSQVMHGDIHQIKLDLDGLKKAVSELIAQTQKANESPIFVELAHVHPGWEIFNASATSDRNTILPLSKTDIAKAKKISQFFPDIVFRISAILPSGYNYSINVRNGEVTL